MIRHLPNYRRQSLRRAMAAGLLSAMLLFTAKPVHSATSAQDQVSRDFQQTVTLGAGQSVHIEHKFGSVRVHGESGREVKISATIRAQASSHEEAESFAQKIQIEVQQTGEGVRVRTVYPDEERRWFHLSKRSSYSVNYDIAISHGSMNVRDVGAVRLSNSFGSIELTGAAGNTFVNDNNGSVQILDVKGTLEVRNRFGNIMTRNIQGG